MQGSWNLTSMTGKKSTNQSSGGKLCFEETSEELAFGEVQTARHREQFGKLVLKRASKKLYEGAGKLIQTDVHPDKQDAEGTRKFQFVPTIKIEPDEFRELYCHLDVSLRAEWFEDTSGKSAGDGRPRADEDDADVVPGSTADHMKQDARRKLAAVSA